MQCLTKSSRLWRMNIHFLVSRILFSRSIWVVWICCLTKGLIVIVVSAGSCDKNVTFKGCIYLCLKLLQLSCVSKWTIICSLFDHFSRLVQFRCWWVLYGCRPVCFCDISSWPRLVGIFGLFVKRLKTRSGSYCRHLPSQNILRMFLACCFSIELRYILAGFTINPGIQRCVPFVSELG